VTLILAPPLIATHCVLAALAVRYYRKYRTVRDDMAGLVDTAHKLGVGRGIAQGVGRALDMVVQSIDSGCDVEDLRTGLANGYVPLLHTNRKVDA
jgi:hypothetical protein